MYAREGPTVGVVAHGGIGREVAVRLKLFMCGVIASDPRVDPGPAEADGWRL